MSISHLAVLMQTQYDLVKLSRLPSLSVLVLLSKSFKKFSLYFQLTISNEGDAEAVGLAIVNTILGKFFDPAMFCFDLSS